MQELEALGNRRARLVLRITSNPPRFIAAMQLGVTATSLAIGALGEPALRDAFDGALGSVAALVLGFLIITYFHVVIGELVPKAVSLSYPERIALGVSTPVRSFFVVFRPLVWVLQRSTELLLGLVGLKAPGTEGAVHSEAELKILLTESTERGEIEHDEREMLYKVFDFADKEASDVMVPRPEVVALSIDLPPADALRAMMDNPYTRYPVYRGSLDDVVGIVHVRDVFAAVAEAGAAQFDLETLVRPAHIVPETKDLAALLTEFRRTNQHMAVVVDEYGATQGIVTLEDLIEEIVGEIEDEFDLPDESVERIDETTVRIDGTFPIDDFNETLGTDLEHEDYHTVAGYVFDLLGRAAEPGDEVRTDGLRFTVLEVEGSRIQRLQVEFLAAEPNGVPEPERERSGGGAEGEAA